MVNNSSDIYLDFGVVFKEIKKYWFLFVLFLFLSFTIAFLFNKFATPTYNITASVLIKDNTNSKDKDLTGFLGGLQLVQGNETFENEILMLQSPELVAKTIQSLNLSVSYFLQEKYIIKKELYKSTPFLIVFDRSHLQPVDVLFKIVFSDANTFNVSISEKNVKFYNYDENTVYYTRPKFEVNRKGKVGTDIIGENYSFKIIPNTDQNLNNYKGKTLYFKFNNYYNLVTSYQSKIKVVPANLKSSVAIISFTSTNIEKGIDVVNALMQQYTANNLERKNFIAERTIEYIDKQLYEIADSLNITERQLQDFRVGHEVMDINTKTGKVSEQMQQLDNQRYTLQVKQRYYQYVFDYFEKNKELSDIPIPSSMGVEDQMLTQLIQQISALNAEKYSMQKNNLEKNPNYIVLNNKIENIKNSIYENLKYSMSTIKLNLDDINQRYAKFQNELNQLPKTERELVGIERKFKLNDAIYTFLLEKRAEAQIAKASNLPDNELVQSAKYNGKSFPNAKINFAIALMLGLILPGSYIFLVNVLNDKINENTNIERLTKVPILGHVLHNYRKSEQVFIQYPKSAIAESFRAIRTNLEYFTRGNDKKVIMLTSTIGKEGKSFTALNLSLCFSVYERKTILLEFDLRKPTLYQKLQSNNLIGLSSYLINKATIDDIIIQTDYPNLDFIPCGPIPPNPTELIAYERTERLINKLKEWYDVIIIDSPPIGLVTDPYLLMKYVDVKIYVVRQNVAPKSDFLTNIKEIESKNIESISILVNDVKYRPGTGKYGYGYYEEAGKFKRLFSFGNNSKPKVKAKPVKV